MNFGLSFMDASPPSTPHCDENGGDKGTVVTNSENNCEVKTLRKCKKKILMKKRAASDVSELTSTSSSSHSSRGLSVAHKRRNPRLLVRRTKGDVSAIGHPLGMSFAAILDQVRFFFSLFGMFCPIYCSPS